MRINLWTLLTVLLSLGAAVYNVADHVQAKEKKLYKLDTHIASEQESLRVLTAEWTFLTNPKRLEKLTASHFKLVPMDGSQYIALAAIPMRDALDAAEAERQGESAENNAITDDNIQQAAAVMPETARALPPLNITPVSATSGGGR